MGFEESDGLENDPLLGGKWQVVAREATRLSISRLWRVRFVCRVVY